MSFQPISDKEIAAVKTNFPKGETTARKVSLKLKVTPRRAHKILDRAGYKILKKGGQGVERIYRRK